MALGCLVLGVVVDPPTITTIIAITAIIITAATTTTTAATTTAAATTHRQVYPAFPAVACPTFACSTCSACPGAPASGPGTPFLGPAAPLVSIGRFLGGAVFVSGLSPCSVPGPLAGTAARAAVAAAQSALGVSRAANALADEAARLPCVAATTSAGKLCAWSFLAAFGGPFAAMGQGLRPVVTYVLAYWKPQMGE